MKMIFCIQFISYSALQDNIALRKDNIAVRCFELIPIGYHLWNQTLTIKFMPAIDCVHKL